MVKKEVEVMGLLDILPTVSKIGWPWDTETNLKIYSKEQNWPKITIVTPSFNQGEYIEETIRSILLQNYPNLEYIIIDGGSSDNTIEVIKKYEPWITYWVSEKDRGQSHAINKGFERASGEIYGWLNSDDIYEKGIFKIVTTRIKLEKPSILIGNATYFYEKENIRKGSDIIQKHHTIPLDLSDYIIQPSSFWNNHTWLNTGELDEKYHFGFDWDWFLRAKRQGAIIDAIPNILSVYRIHEGHKSGSGGEKRVQELAKIYEKYNGCRLKNAYLRWSKLRQSYYRINSYWLKMRVNKLVSFDKIFYNFFIKEISFEEFMAMRGM